MIATHLEFLVSFLPADTRRLSRTGIQIHCLEYWSDQLAPWVGERRHVLVHYDPRDISVLYVRTPGGAIVVASAKKREIGPISKVEWDFRRAIERGMGRDSALVAMADESLKRSDEIVAQSKRKRSVERRSATRAAGDRLLPPQAAQGEREIVPPDPVNSTDAVIYSIEGMDDEF